MLLCPQAPSARWESAVGSLWVPNCAGPKQRYGVGGGGCNGGGGRSVGGSGAACGVCHPPGCHLAGLGHLR